MVVVQKSDIAEVVNPLVAKPEIVTLKGVDHDVILWSDIKTSLRPVIERYTPLADWNQRIQQEVVDMARSYLEKQGFSRLDHRPF